ncbi:dynein axonemal assembly factor 3-like isoform X1 [Ctenopharyngodon idella]|uniref:dynein axonemal assembly factor 3-like isoform X1 n=2 Tax=Ctenopharyngodon idella TaxID=7959 RepID=UPI002232357A|nr:dynein axonemal assembly factor 3-like isoform X1 [Ctenopharyngodon idella]XP_051737434.1 dynein axonemal assembly factor 3-like isoform X1 [Ctenopharyngodon idella]XP_051737435.1 dynein axonemal assembly factor 3-like isoform X1 [Ctenopharyngodon idella]
MSAGRTVEGAGCVTWWGFGPARDLLSSENTVRSHGELNVLLVGSGDPRHILKTITGLRDSDTLHVWVIENSMEVVARQLLLLYLSLLTPENISIHKKTEVFLEVFGNSEIRKETEETLKHAAAQLSLSITNTLSSDSHTHPCLDTSLLKFKERDELVRIFKLWERPPSVPASVRKVWDARVRQHLGTRYDSRQGCFDWDLTMKLHQRGCGVISKHQYVKWRETGVAFEMREGLYQSANQSLLSTRVFNHRGDRVAVRGYWGDIISSPYLSFGIETENKDLLKTQNNQHIKTAQDISEVNVLALFECLATRGSSLLNEDVPNPSSSCCQSTDSLITEEKIQNDPPSSQTHTEPEQQTQELDLLNVSGVKVSFLSPDSLTKLSLKNKYRNLFNSIFCSASMVHQLDSSLREITAPDAALVIELANFLLDLSKEQASGFADRVKEIAEESGFTPTHNQSSDVYAVFTRKKH